MDIEILKVLKTSKHQSKATVQQKEPISILSAKTTFFTPKGVLASVITATLYLDNSAHSIVIPLGVKHFN
uniref:Uncharacterized protein n=1 Tax=Rhizophagus irregularis (strain DAOM 181602 / DAOM 197198 / MUCL 43194) TaxID=747089 RepID=U9U549_RHIID